MAGTVRLLLGGVVIKKNEILLQHTHEAFSGNMVGMLELFLAGRVCFSLNCIHKAVAAVPPIFLLPDMELGTGIVDIDIGRAQRVALPETLSQYLNIENKSYFTRY
jgi:hypothetical protein